MKRLSIWIQRLAGMFGVFIFAGCATMFQGRQQEVVVTTEPTPAQVTVLAGESSSSVDSGGETYPTKPGNPLALTLSRGSSYRLVVSKEGYQTQTVNIGREVPFKWWLLDAFSLGLGTIVDALTGALFDLKPTLVHTVLEPLPETSGAPVTGPPAKY